MYGSSEAEPIASIDTHEVSVVDRATTREGGGLLVGKPVAGCAVRIIQSRPQQSIGSLTVEEFSDIRLDTGAAGEIVVSGDHVIPGYVDPAQDRECKIRVNGMVWHRTGDAGYFDASGRLWLVGRCGAALSDYRGTVYPFQVEYAVSAVRGIRRAALIRKEEERVLVLETANRDFRYNCAAAAKCVAHFDIERIVTVPRIPVDKRHDAKVDYPALQKLLDGQWQIIRNGLAEIVSEIFTFCRDSLRRIQSRRRIRPL